MQETIEALLKLAITAPSGDNIQPWRLKVRSDQIDLYNVPTADTSYYNYKQRASLVAHGALLENVAVAAPQFGFDAKFNFFPTHDDSDHVAQIALAKCSPFEGELAKYIEQRTTNRKKYRGGLLDAAQLNLLAPNSEDLPSVSVFLTNKRAELDRLSEVICLSDRLVYENKRLHSFLYDHIRWSDEEAATYRDGLDIKTLELNTVDSLGLKLLQNWTLTNLLGKLGATRAIAANARSLARSASAIGVILGTDSQDPVTYLQGGRLLQRVWLQATLMGLSFHPMTGISFLMQRVADNHADELSPQHIILLRDAIRRVAISTGCHDPNVISLFRVGFADPPTARSMRKELLQAMA